MITFDGRWAPKRIVDTFVASEKVGEGGPGDVLRLEAKNDVGAMADPVRLLYCAMLNVVHACFPFVDIITASLLVTSIYKFLVI